MRVLIAYCYSLPHVGGLWTYVHELRQALEKKGHSVAILGADARNQHYYLLGTDQTVRTRSFSSVVKPIVEQYYKKRRPKLDSWILNREIFRYSFELAAAYFGLQQYDIIHTQDAESTRAIWRVKPAKTPLISTFHCSHTRETFVAQTKAPGTMRWRYVAVEEKLAVNAADNLIVPSNWLHSIIQADYHPEKNHIRVIPHGIDAAMLRARMAAPSPLERKEGIAAIVCVARLVPEKGHRYLFEALAQLKKVRQDWVCWLVGDGYLRRTLTEMRDRVGLQEQVVFAGSQENVPSILAQADIFVLPSMLETLGYAAMEAQLAGKAVIVTDAGGLGEVVQHMQTGMVVPTGQIAPLSASLLRLLDDRKLARRLGANARRWARKQWPVENMLGQTMDVYRNAFDQVKRAAGSESEGMVFGNQPIKPFARLFAKRYANKVEDMPLWKAAIASLPDGYAIPDGEIAKRLTADT
ncbi:glycosyltransferase family 4 protein [Brevibacillus fluminis]|uniref:glycosyltransferase family 4 protein n=1 Tax=Brevibacillus fluminis TaxID=511487 RepID=UPI003F8CE003